MSYRHTEAHSPYLVWVKTQPKAKYNLATSGVSNLPLSKLPVRIEDLAISGQTPGYGYAPLQESLARHARVSKECVVAAIGTSMANYLAYAGTLEPGDNVQFEPIDPASFASIRKAVDRGKYEVAHEPISR